MIEKLKSELGVSEVELVRNQEGKPRLITFVKDGVEFRFTNDKNETLLLFIEGIIKSLEKIKNAGKNIKEEKAEEKPVEEVKKKDVTPVEKSKKK